MSICHATSIECWLRGGWGMDFFLASVTRAHEDIDLFVWARDASKLVRGLQGAGFAELDGPPPEAQRDLTRDGEEVQVALLDRNERGQVVVAGGPWAGSPWPDGMLDGSVGRIGELICPIVNPSVQVKIKERFREWRADLPVRDKHQADIARLREALGCTGR